MLESCRHCGGATEPVLDLGPTPLVDQLWPDPQSALAAPRYALLLTRCPTCTLVQLGSTRPAEQLFSAAYPYCSSVIDSVVESARLHALQLIAERRLAGNSLVIEAASNDGYQLRWFAEQNIPVLGIDPAQIPAATAIAAGIPTITRFFNRDLAQQLSVEGHQADLILAKNVLAHVSQPHDFLAGVATLLKPDGLACFEFPYLAQLLKHGQFDTIYHEHRCYLSVTTLQALLQPHQLQIQRIVEIPLHGGSLRVDVGFDAVADAGWTDYLLEERRLGINERSAVDALSAKVHDLTNDIADRVHQLKAQGLRVAAYGAAAKGVVLLNRCGLDHRQLDYVVDRNPHKIGQYMPGSGLLIRHPDVLQKHPPNALLLLAWNHHAEIQTQQSTYSANGGRWILPQTSN